MNEDHDNIRALVAEYDLARLTPEDRRLVEEHIAGCRSCAELAEDVRLLRRQIRLGGEAMFEPHPEPAALRDYARRPAGPESRIGRHITLCAACRLEVEACQRSGEGRVPVRAGAGAMWLRVGLASAAAALLGVVVGWRFHAIVDSSIATPAPAGPRVSAPDQGAPLAVQAPVLHLLPGILRSGEPPQQRWILDHDTSSIGVAVPMMLPVSPGETDRFRFEIGRPGGESVWSQEMTAARIREHLEAAEVVNLIIVPPQALAEGDYEFRVVPSAPAGGTPPIYRARITIAYRQSPAATKAPQ